MKMGKNGRGILKITDYFREALNPCMACQGKTQYQRETCLDCHGTGRQSSEQKRKYLGSKEVMGRI